MNSVTAEEVKEESKAFNEWFEFFTEKERFRTKDQINILQRYKSLFSRAFRDGYRRGIKVEK